MRVCYAMPLKFYSAFVCCSIVCTMQVEHFRDYLLPVFTCSTTFQTTFLIATCLKWNFRNFVRVLMQKVWDRIWIFANLPIHTFRFEIARNFECNSALRGHKEFVIFLINDLSKCSFCLKWHEKFCNRKIFFNLICVCLNWNRNYLFKVSDLPRKKNNKSIAPTTRQIKRFVIERKKSRNLIVPRGAIISRN